MHLKTLAVTFVALLLAGCSDRIGREESELSVDDCIGSWRLASFCNIPTDIDIYISIRNDGTFTLYQRNTDYTPVSFSGSYAFDAESRMISGFYDDGTAWVDSYIVEDADEKEMIWANAEDKSEISVYTRSDIPASMLGEVSRTSFVEGAIL